MTGACGTEPATRTNKVAAEPGNGLRALAQLRASRAEGEADSLSRKVRSMVLPTSARAVRQSMASLPRALQPALTWLSGLPLTDEAPFLTWRPMTRMITAYLALVLWVTVTVLSLKAGGLAWLVVPVSTGLTTGVFRYLYIVISHMAVHRELSPDPRLNKLLGELASTISLTKPFTPFSREHAHVHHSSRLATREDPEGQLIFDIGIQPGMTVAESRRRLALFLFSPRYHLSFFWTRLRDNFAAGEARRRGFAIGFWGLVLTVVASCNAWVPFGLAVVLPLTALYQVSAVLQYMSEHRWMRVKAPGETNRDHYEAKTFGRFLGDMTPSASPRGLAWAKAWAGWWLRLLFLHLPARLFVLVGDLPQHDLHHHRPRSDWANAIHAREAAIASGWRRGEGDEVVGSLLRMIDEVLDSIRRTPKP